MCWHVLVHAGAAQADAALLVVDGSVGGFEAGFSSSAGGGGQTREHAQLARSLGIDQLAVVISKLDTCNFSQVHILLDCPLLNHKIATSEPHYQSVNDFQGASSKSYQWRPCLQETPLS